jgi:hypothetical protein
LKAIELVIIVMCASFQRDEFQVLGK